MFQFEKIVPSIPFILAGVWTTLLYVSVSIILGLIIGCLLSFCRLSKVKAVSLFASVYVSIFRGTPLLVQLSIVYFATPQLTGYKMTAFEAGVISFSLNSAAYIAEIIRGGILSVDRGQTEAAQSLGIKSSLVMWDIILPQAIKTILPALVNEFTSLLKESVIISIIGEMDLLRRAQLVSSQTYVYFEPLLLIAAVYYVLVVGLTTFAKLLERRLRRSD